MSPNPALLKSMIERYNFLSVTSHFIFGFYYQKTVYVVHAESNILPFILKLDKASRGAGYSLRFSPTTAQKILLLSQGAIALCSQKCFEKLRKQTKYNRGEFFEKLITETVGQDWIKGTAPFYSKSDLIANGIKYQIKFEKATFTNEKILLNQEKVKTNH